MKHALQSVAMLAVLLAPFLGGASPDLIADGRGLTGLGNITIEHSLDLSGANGGGNGLGVRSNPAHEIGDAALSSPERSLASPIFMHGKGTSPHIASFGV